MMRVADHWYDTRKLTNELTLIYEPHVHPFLRCNIWHLRGRDKDLLVDTGLGVSSLKNAIADKIDKLVMALATHIHYDHVGCLHEFDERLMYSSESAAMLNYSEFSWLRIADFPQNYQAGLRTDDYQDYLINARPDENYDIKNYQLPPPVSPVTLMKEMLSTLAIKHSWYTTCRAIHPAALVYGIHLAAHSSLATPSTMANFWTRYRDRTSRTTSTP